MRDTAHTTLVGACASAIAAASPYEIIDPARDLEAEAAAAVGVCMAEATHTIEAQPSTWLEGGDPRVNDPVPYLERDALLAAVRRLGDTP